MAMIKFMLEVDLAVTQIVSAMLKIQMNQHFVRKPPQLLKNNAMEQVKNYTSENKIHATSMDKC